jgi:hypothetical protein
MRFLLLALLMVLGCSRASIESTVETESTRSTLRLENGWNQHPWKQGSATGRSLQLSTEFRLEETHDLAGSQLILDGLWWKATVSVNGLTLPEVTGGNAPGVLAIGAALVPGLNTLKIQIDAPTAETVRETGGWLLEPETSPQGSKPNQRRAELRAAPRIELKPAVHIAQLDLPMSGVAVLPRARIQGATDGGQVRFLAALDGEVLADLGSAQIDAEGEAQGEPVLWRGPLWTPQDPQLIQLVGILEDEDGEILDLWARRIGVRQVQAGSRSLLFNGTPRALMAARAITKPKAGPLETRLGAWAEGGVNAIEIHGENAPESWLSMADELGIPVILLPRCIGRSLDHGNAVSQSLIERLVDQDRRLVESTSTHPSVVLWMTEGASTNSKAAHRHVPMWTEALLEDPQQRPVVDHHLGGRLLQVDAKGSRCNTGSCSGAWIAEITGHGQGPDPWLAMGQAYVSAVMGEGALGGTIPIPQSADTRWAQTWSVLGTGLGVRPMSKGPHRAPSIVRLTGLQPGQIGWVEARWSPTVGGVADSDGSMSLELWHAGEATVRTEDWSQTVVLSPGTWQNFTLQSPGVAAHP